MRDRMREWARVVTGRSAGFVLAGVGSDTDSVLVPIFVDGFGSLACSPASSSRRSSSAA
jgi:hypothetical protein